MIIDYCEQGTPEWHKARAGIPTASNFNRIITSKGEPSKQREQYILELAAAAVAGPEGESFDTYWMKRGRDLEPSAIALYEFETGNEAHSVGFVYRDEDRRVGCSPDNLAWEDGVMGGLEVKSPAPKTHVAYLLANKLPSEYFHQVQGCMWVTGAPWWDFESYCPGMRPLLVRTYPDATYHEALSRAIPTFLRDLDAVIERIR